MRSTCQIYVKTYSGDRDYHVHCMRSIEKFCTGFGETVVEDSDQPRGYLAQQVSKLHCDLLTSSDLILVTDSDTLFIEPVTPESFMRDGKPVWLMTPWNAEMLANPGTRAWYDVMGQFFNEVPPYEFMRRQPFMFPASVLPRLREFCRTKHGRFIEEYIMERGVFSEWNVAGMFCWLYCREEFYWLDTEKEPLPPLLVRQFWSHDPLHKNIKEIEEILK